MADQGKAVITMTVPASSARGTLVSGAGTKSATLRAVGVMLDSTDASTTKGPVQISGTALVLLGANLTAGALFTADADGEAIAHVEDTDAVNGTDHLICGVLLEGGSAGELRSAKLL